jgi:hypothetical protein
LPIGAGSPYSFAFSKNDDYFAYVTSLEENAVHIVSFETGEDVPYKVSGKIEFLQKFIWSPDSSRLVFVNGFLLGEDETTSLMLFDMREKEFSTLISNDQRRFVPTGWVSNDEVVLESWGGEQGIYKYNIESMLLEKYTSS